MSLTSQNLLWLPTTREKIQSLLWTTRPYLIGSCHPLLFILPFLSCSLCSCQTIPCCSSNSSTHSHSDAFACRDPCPAGPSRNYSHSLCSKVSSLTILCLKHQPLSPLTWPSSPLILYTIGLSIISLPGAEASASWPASQ